jgi:bifunctional UDP-N-acetylglucosamine pyrophosphorylase/glucosamine-1-phosphate N-acetyltransferase
MMISVKSSNFAIAIMAAGKGTRLKSARAKVLHQIGGRTLLAHVIAAAAQVVAPKDIYVIIGHQAEAVRNSVAQTGVQFVLQKEQRGTGHAIQELKKYFTAGGITPPEHLLVLSGDVPLIRPQTIAAVRDFHLKQRAAMTILTARPADPTGYGRIVRVSTRSPQVKAIVEQKALKPAQLKIAEINSGIYAFRTKPLFEKIDKLGNKNAHGTDVAALLVAAKQKVLALPASDAIEILGANTIAEMMQLDAAMRAATAARLMANGVSIFRPDTCVIDSTVTVAPDAIIEPYVQLLGNTSIGSGTIVRSYSVIKDSQVAQNVLIRHGSIMDRSSVGDGAWVGPYANLRPQSEIGAGAHMGNFVETKKAKIGPGCKVNHLSYVGDATLGANVNLGAGSITCNNSGLAKNPTVIEDGAFIGSNVTLIAPITIGKDAYVGAASCVTEDVPADALALGRARQVTKPGWAAARRAAKQPGSC